MAAMICFKRACSAPFTSRNTRMASLCVFCMVELMWFVAFGGMFDGPGCAGRSKGMSDTIVHSIGFDTDPRWPCWPPPESEDTVMASAFSSFFNCRRFSAFGSWRMGVDSGCSKKVSRQLMTVVITGDFPRSGGEKRSGRTATTSFHQIHDLGHASTTNMPSTKKNMRIFI